MTWTYRRLAGSASGSGQRGAAKLGTLSAHDVAQQATRGDLTVGGLSEPGTISARAGRDLTVSGAVQAGHHRQTDDESELSVRFAMSNAIGISSTKPTSKNTGRPTMIATNVIAQRVLFTDGSTFPTIVSPA